MAGTPCWRVASKDSRAIGQGHLDDLAGGGFAYTAPLTEAAVVRAVAANVLVVASAGNSPLRVATPARLEGVLAIGATTSTDVMGTFSGRGPELDIVAPGENITSVVSGGVARVEVAPHGLRHTFQGLSLCCSPSASGLHKRRRLRFVERKISAPPASTMKLDMDA